MEKVLPLTCAIDHDKLEKLGECAKGRSMPMQSLVSFFFEKINTRNLDEFGFCLADNAEFYFPKTHPLLGKTQILRFFNILFRRFPRLEFEVQKVIVEEQSAAIHWKNKGVNRKQESYENEGVTLIEARDEKITWISDFFKDTGKF
jgi:ketosteroid isomerase-like protein